MAADSAVRMKLLLCYDLRFSRPNPFFRAFSFFNYDSLFLSKEITRLDNLIKTKVFSIARS